MRVHEQLGIPKFRHFERQPMEQERQGDERHLVYVCKWQFWLEEQQRI